MGSSATRFLVLTPVFFKKYEKSIQEGYDDYSLIDYSIIKPQEKDYKDWSTYWQAHVQYLKDKYKYTYGSKETKK